MQRHSLTRRVNAQARIAGPLLCVLLAAVVAGGCSSGGSSKTSAAARAAEKSASSQSVGGSLVLNGVNRNTGSSAGTPAWDNQLVSATTAATAPTAATSGTAGTAASTATAPTLATIGVSTAPTVMKLLSDGTIDDGTDPFEAMLRIPAVRPTFIRRTATTPVAVHPDGATLDEWPVKSSIRGVVKIATINCGGMSSGSGWVAGSEMVVTNAHVVAGAERRPRVQVNGTGFRYPAAVVYLDVPNDIAILRVPGMKGASILPMAKNPQPGDPAAIVGFPNGGDVHLDAAQLGATQVDTTQQYDGWRRNVSSRTNTYVSGFSEPGNSGGPVVNAKGEVLATVWGNEYDRQPPLTVAIPDSLVSAALAAAGSSEISAGPCIAK